MDPRLMMRLTDFLNVHVVNESGDKLGRVHDLRAERTPRTLKVTGSWSGSAASSSGSASALPRRGLESGPTTSFRGRRSCAPIAEGSSYGTMR